MKNLTKNTLTNALKDKKGGPEYLSLKYPRKEVDKPCLVRHSVKIQFGQRIVLNFLSAYLACTKA